MAKKKSAADIRIGMYIENDKRKERIEKEVKRRTKKTLIPKVTSLGDLFNKACKDPRYAQLTLLAASNLGLPVNTGNVHDIAATTKAIKWLRTNAQETDERGVVSEINFVRDCVTTTETEF